MNRIYLYNDGIGCVDLVAHMGTDLTIVNAARVSFNKHKAELDDQDKRLIRYLAEHRHTSTFEHNVVTFRFTVPLYVRSQHHRHRTWSYNEISRRYTEEDLKFYEPVAFRTQHASNRQASNRDSINPEFEGRTAADHMRAQHASARELYESLLASGVCREQARGVLPQNLYTSYYGTTNLNNLIRFIDLRLDKGAQWEIQQVAKACLTFAAELWPHAIGAAFKEG